MFLKSWSSTGWQVFWALRSTGLGKGGTRWGTWRKLCKKSWLAWPANSCLTIYARLEEEKWEIMTMVQAQEKGKIDNEGGELTTRHIHNGEGEWCQIEWIHIWKVSKHQSRCYTGLEVKHCNMLIWKWDLVRGKTLKEEEVQQYCFQCKWFMMSCLHGEAERLATDDKRWSFCKTAPKVGQTHLAEHLGMATLSSFLTVDTAAS